MHLTILGSGTNLHPERAAAGYLVTTDQVLLLDFGPRTLVNLLKTRVNRHRLRYILFTHYHADHCSDFVTFFFDALMHAKLVAPREDLAIFGPRGSKRLFRRLFSTFPGFNEAPFRITVHEVANRSFSIGETRITPRPVVHSRRVSSVGYRVEHLNRSLAYSGDAQYSQSLVALCRNVDVAVLDCSFSGARPGDHHMHAGECGRVAQEAGVRHLILSHFYPQTERYDVCEEARRWYQGRISMARDLMHVSLPPCPRPPRVRSGANASSSREASLRVRRSR